MIIDLTTPPTDEPVTLQELKAHLKVNSGTLAESVDEVQSIAPDEQSTTVGYDLEGGSVEITSDTALVYVQSGTNGGGGTVDVKIQDSVDDITFADWGAFDQITTANDNDTFEIEYTGTKDYIRTVAKVLVASCSFGTTVVQYSPTSGEDDLLGTILIAARRHVENVTGRQLMTATWDYSIQDWPDSNRIKLPFGNLVSVSSVKWKDSDGDETTLTVTDDYLVETNSGECGFVVLPYGISWPSGSLYPSNPITIQYVCGYASAALVPETLQVAIKFSGQNFWRHGGESEDLNNLVKMLTNSYRLHDSFC